MCRRLLDGLYHLTWTHGTPSSGQSAGIIESMKCQIRLLSIFALVMGLISCGTLTLAIAMDYWLLTEEPVRQMYPEQGNYVEISMILYINTGLWRGCFRYQLDGIDEPIVGECFNINYGGVYGRTDTDQFETTWAILRSMRKSSPVLVISLLGLILGFAFSTVGNTKGDYKTLVGAVLYIAGALTLALGVIFYISAVNDEVHHRKKPDNPDEPAFKYAYGFAFFFGGSSFITSMITAVANISLYLKRYSNYEDMVAIIPGLQKKGPLGFSKETNESHEESLDFAIETQAPTVIL